MPKLSNLAKVESALIKLPELPREELAAIWLTRTGHAPPKGCGRGLLELAEAYALQASAFGGLKPCLGRRLASNSLILPKIKSRQLSQGSKLVREWNGRTHHVDVVPGGFVWNGNKHQSLSAIAKEITSAHWSGPRFFGL